MKRRVACVTSSGGPQSTSARTQQPCPAPWGACRPLLLLCPWLRGAARPGALAPHTAHPGVKALCLPEWASQRSPFLLSHPSPWPPAGPCSALQGAEDPRPSHLPGTGVRCSLLDSGRRSLSPGPRRYPHSCTGSGSRERGLQGCTEDTKGRRRRPGSELQPLCSPTRPGAGGPPPSPPQRPRGCRRASRLSPQLRLPRLRGRAIPAHRTCLLVCALARWPPPPLPISQCRPEKPGGQSHLYLPM